MHLDFYSKEPYIKTISRYSLVVILVCLFSFLVLCATALHDSRAQHVVSASVRNDYKNVKCELVSEEARLKNLVAARINLLETVENQKEEITRLKDKIAYYENILDDKVANSDALFEDEPEIISNIPKVHVSDSFVYYTHYFDERSQKYHSVKMEESIQKFVFSCCQKHNVPYEIIMGIMGVETGWKHEIGYKGKYYGIGMINVELAKEYLATLGINLTTPEGGIEGTCAIFAKKLKAFDGDIPMAILAYNRGNGGAKSYIRENNVLEATYVKRVLMIAKSLTTQLIEEG